MAMVEELKAKEMKQRRTFIDGGVVGAVGAVSRTSKKPYSTSWSGPRKWVAVITESVLYKLAMAASIVLNMILLIYETDLRASARTAHWDEYAALSDFSFTSPGWMGTLSNALIFYYLIDLNLRIFVVRRNFFKSSSNQFDFAIVSIDCCVVALEPLQDLPSVAVLRMLRMLRIVRVLRNFLVFRELYLMMQGLVSAIRSIVFATLLIAVVLLLWSIMAVELVHQRNIELSDKDFYGPCSYCREAFSSVSMSALTFLKGIVAGDSWGLMSIPLIVNYPETSFVILGSLLMVQLGLLNLIVAVIVDRAAVARENDDELKFTEKQEGLEASYNRLKNLFLKIDADGGGTLSLKEIQQSYDTEAEFREILDLMDIRHQDLELVFDILDTDGDGEVSYMEFVEQLHEVKTLNSHTALIYIKHYAQSISSLVTAMETRVANQLAMVQQLHSAILVPEAQANGKAEAPKAAGLSSGHEAKQNGQPLEVSRSEAAEEADAMKLWKACWSPDKALGRREGVEGLQLLDLSRSSHSDTEKALIVHTDALAASVRRSVDKSLNVAISSFLKAATENLEGSKACPQVSNPLERACSESSAAEELQLEARGRDNPITGIGSTLRGSSPRQLGMTFPTLSGSNKPLIFADDIKGTGEIELIMQDSSHCPHPNLHTTRLRVPRDCDWPPSDVPLPPEGNSQHLSAGLADRHDRGEVPHCEGKPVDDVKLGSPRLPAEPFDVCEPAPPPEVANALPVILPPS